jgi:hypothetical protein
VTPPQEQSTAPVVRRSMPDTAIATPTPPSTPSTPPSTPSTPPSAPQPPVKVPGDAIYVCVTEDAGVRRQIAIEFEPKVHALCRRHPEMGPCQYERNVCRRSGGRVFAAGGEEITMATEAEYDRKVMRVRFLAK